MKYLALLLLLSFNISAAEWSKEDQQRQLIYTFVHVLDWAQTLEIASSSGAFFEKNKILGKHPTRTKVNIYMSLTLAGHWAIAKNINKKHRRSFQLTSIGVIFLTVLRNQYLGLTIRF